MKWLLERDVFDNGICNEIGEQLDYRNQEYMISMINITNEDRVFKELGSHQVMFYGSMNTMKRLQYLVKNQQVEFTLVDYCPWNKFRMSVVYNRFGDWCLNDNYIIATVEEVYKQAGFFFEKIGLSNLNTGEGQIFCKSDDADKKFTGDVYNVVTIEQMLKCYLDTDYVTMEDLLILSEPKNLGKEYRLVMARCEHGNCKYVTGSIYMQNGNLVKNPDDLLIPQKVIDFAKASLYGEELYGVGGQHIGRRNGSYYTPCDIFLMDVVEFKYMSEPQLRVVELGSINVAGLYGCDVSKIVDKLIELET